MLGQVVIRLGGTEAHMALGPLGRSYALELAQRGCKIVVNE